ncbi:hypothetical protein SAMN06298216_4412 [Spirosomataceae bacterium TFI 002]|nr:hypothetical protein SAMN06298216_4412 [Spirosomataceae bacterium TFI 002]
MLKENERELNNKIVLILETISESSSVFADFIGITRPAMSHITNFRNKPSLEIIQKIVSKFPELGIEWTFDDVELDQDLLKRVRETYQRQKAAEEHALRESNILGSGGRQQQIFDSQASSFFGNSKKKIVRIVLIYEDETFSEITPSN